MADGVPGLSTCCRSARRGPASRSPSRSARRADATCSSTVGRRRTSRRAGVRPHLTGGSGAEAATTYGVGNCCWRRSTPVPPGSWWARRQRHERRRCRPARRARRDRGPAARPGCGRTGRRHAVEHCRRSPSSWWPERRRQPADRALRRDQGSSGRRGHRRDRLPVVDGLLEELAAATDRRCRPREGPARPADWASRSSCSGPAASRAIDLVARALRLPERGPPPTWC